MRPMLDRAQMKTIPLLNKATDMAPAVQVCCGVCRSCSTTNVFAVAGLAISAASGFLARQVQRLGRRA
jgi:hypothetical protein